MKSFRNILSYTMLIVFIPTFAWAWQGRVVSVADGDTITVLHEGKGEKVRLYGVDTPEKRQDFGQKAKQFTSDQVFGRIVEVMPIDTDRYGRTVGIVFFGGQCLNRNLVEAGLAWVYERYCRKKECSAWRTSQEKARASKLGLWSIPDPTPPWEFRRAKSTQNW
ncbi:MAG: thermonuclease family protein [Syntrophobacteraceae bacterium]